LSNQTVHLFSDLLVHHMGKGLADGITQGAAGPDEFRTAPLWGVGQRIFFLHDGRTSNLVEAIRAHKSRGSEANQVVGNFNKLSTEEQQGIIDFLRAL
ncbi:MAG TPA: di-heme oxidoredictase family protein, partial [Candidatus Sulfotelmatobacter sp.]|nr:di-heme oxidoredictase family protein [Candidatus Sulfotelmatobacter sp.]